MTSSFQKCKTKIRGIISSGVMTILVGTGENVPIWEHWEIEG